VLNLIKKDEEINFLNMSVLLPPIDPVETAKQVWPWFWYPFIFVMKYLWPFLLVGILWKIFEKKLDTSVQNFIIKNVHIVYRGYQKLREHVDIVEKMFNKF